MEPQTSPQGTNRKRAIYAAIAAAAAIVIAVGAFALLRDDSSANDDASAGASTSSSSVTDATTRGSTKPKPSTSTTAKAGTKGGSSTTAPGATPTTAGNGGSGGTNPGARPTIGPGQGPGTTINNVTPVAVVEAYRNGYVNECKSIWTIAGSDGILYDADDADHRPFLVDDCTSLIDLDQADYQDNPQDAQQQGYEDAFWNLDDIMAGRRLRNADGSKVWVSPLSRPA